MKIGIITFHRANNLGANLQAFALNKFVNDNIDECEIIDFVPNNQVDNRSVPVRMLSLAKRIVLFPFDKRGRSFEKFKKRNYKLSKKTYIGDNALFADPPKYDVLISGSDQILNTALSGMSKSFYLAFDDKTRKISYASSFGRDTISRDEETLIDSELPKFAALSVREQSGADIIKRRIGVDAPLVLDPVFLMTGEEWRAHKAKIKAPRKYIFVYSMEVTEQLKFAISQAKEKLGVEALVVYGGGEKALDAKEIKHCGPQEFLSYIDGAELVVTNSFHGTAFSLIFNKNFVCVAHSTRNARLENILALCKASDKMICETQKNEFCYGVIDGEKAGQEISVYIKDSKNFILKNICAGDLSSY